jgi:hypothetical protein
MRNQRYNARPEPHDHILTPNPGSNSDRPQIRPATATADSQGMKATNPTYPIQRKRKSRQHPTAAWNKTASRKKELRTSTPTSRSDAVQENVTARRPKLHATRPPACNQFYNPWDNPLQLKSGPRKPLGHAIVAANESSSTTGADPDWLPRQLERRSTCNNQEAGPQHSDTKQPGIGR